MGIVCFNCFHKKDTLGPCPFCGYNSADDEDRYPLALKAGAILNGRYTVGRVLGQGGFGITYIAQDYQTWERVAVKEYLPTDFAGRNPDSNSVQIYSGDRRENYEYGKARFLEEAKTLAAFIGDEHIVRIYSYFEENNTAYFVMEYVDGYALDQYMARKGGRLSVEEANRLLLPLMSSLGAVHAKGIIHRDIAPDNILITKDGSAKLIDFGAARYSTGEKSKSLDVVLKHGFAPKEQYLRRGRQGPFTDVYALAATYYYAITGKVPPESIERMDEDDLIPPSSLGVRLSSEAEDALYKALEVNSQDRYRNMEEFHSAMTVAVNPYPETGKSNVPPKLKNTGRSVREEAALLEKKLQELRAEAERQEREEKERLARIEAARLEQERREREAREQAEREERERKEREAREAEERRRREAREAEERRRQEARAEAERLKKERAEQKAREEAARQEKLRLEREKREKEKRLAAEKKKKEAEEKERLRQETLAKRKAEQEQKRAEAERLKKEREEKKALQAKEKAQRKQKERERNSSVKADRADADRGSAESSASEKHTAGKKSRTPIIAAVAAVLVAAAAVGYYFSPGQTAKRNYKTGIELMETGQYNEAVSVFSAIDDESLQAKLPSVWYAEGLERKNAGDWDAAAEAFTQAGNYEDAALQIAETRYSQGISLKEAKDWENAAAALTLAGSYKDSSVQLQEVRYLEASEYLDNGRYEDALTLFTELGVAGYKDSAEKAKTIQRDPKYLVQLWADPQVGDSVYFGNYEQDNDPENGKEPVEWQVLAREEDRILVISKFGLDCQRFNSKSEKITWETCSLRKWLNNSFLSAAFSSSEQTLIPTVSVSADKNPTYDTDPGNETRDKVFLLSITEADAFFSSKAERVCKPTAYASNAGCNEYKGGCRWWLRSPGYPNSMHYERDNENKNIRYKIYYALATDYFGNIEHEGYMTISNAFAVRPAMWIDLRGIYLDYAMSVKEDRPFLGITVDALRRYGVHSGCYVSDITSDSAAEKAGILPGDIITAIGGVETPDYIKLRYILFHYNPNDKAEITVYRKGKLLPISVVFDKYVASYSVVSAESDNMSQLRISL